MNKKIAVLTSGGDAPGMNAAIRAIVRTATYRGVEVLGIRRGYTGLLDGHTVTLGPRDVANTIQRGGTFLLSAREKRFHTPEGRALAAANLRAWGVDALFVIGGDGSFHGAHFLMEEQGIPVIGLPGTIDNDLYGTDYTIGYFTAVETALDAIDKLRDTGASHERVFVVEVMGRHAGHIALDVAIAGGAEEVLIPEDDEETSIQNLLHSLRASLQRNKGSSVIVVAEGFEGGADRVRKLIEEDVGIESRTAILGHIQRGGIPCAADRVLASRLGEAAVHLWLDENINDVMVGLVNNQISLVPLAETWEKRKDVNRSLYSCAKTLAI